MRRQLTLITIAIVAGLTAFTSAAKPPPTCKSLPRDIREASRQFNDCLRTENPTANCGPSGLNVQVFDNDEHRLPKAGNGQTYYEARATTPPRPMPGASRLVFLTNDSGGRPDIVARYYSADHYTSFCSLD